jgi:hypothetical protein
MSPDGSTAAGFSLRAMLYHVPTAQKRARAINRNVKQTTRATVRVPAGPEVPFLLGGWSPSRCAMLT